MFIKDQEIDFVTKKDLLGGKHYADALYRALKNTPSDKTFTIGLFGEWGCGKSSIIRTTKKLIEAEENSEEIKFIEYDAWRYSGNSFKRMFLLQVAKSLNVGTNEFFDRFYTNRTEKKFNRYGWGGVLIVTAILILTSIFFREHLLEIGIISFLTYILALFANVMNIFTETSDAPLTFAPEQFHECFEELIDCSLNGNDKTTRTEYKWVKNTTKHKKFSKVIIVIDNLDRSNQCAEILNDIKNFLSDYNNLIFIIPVDHYQLCQRYGSFNQPESLRKIFNLEIRIKPLEDGEIFEFAEHLNTEFKLGFSQEVLAVISNQYATNPRRIIHFFNNLSAEFELAKERLFEDDIKEHQSLICKALLIREEYPAYYKQIVKNPNLLVEREARKELIKHNQAELEQLNRFLNYTHRLAPDTHFNILQKIVSNRKSYDGIQPEIFDAIRWRDIDKLAPYLETNRDLIVNKLISDLKLNIERGLLGYTIDQLEPLALINKRATLSRHEANSILDAVQDKFESIIPFVDTEFYNELSLLISHIHSLGIRDISIATCNFLRNSMPTAAPVNVNYDKAKKLFAEIITKPFAIDILGPTTNGIFYNYYTKLGTSVDFKNVPDIEFFYSENLIKHSLNHIRKLNDIEFDNFIELLRPETPDNLVQSFYHKTDSLLTSYTTGNKAEFIKLIEQLDKAITKSNSKPSSLQPMLSKIFTQPQMVRTTLIEDSSDDEIKLITSFLIKVNKLFDNTLDISGLSSFNKFETKTQQVFLDTVKGFIDSGYLAHKYWNKISSIKSIGKQYFDILYKISEEKHTNGNYFVDDHLLHSKVGQTIKDFTPNELVKALKTIPDDCRLYKTFLSKDSTTT